MTTILTPLGNTYFNDLVREIALPESVYLQATERYKTVGDWLEKPASLLSEYSPTIYPQGSIALGTAIRPLAGDEHDVDAVCLLEELHPPIPQQYLKELVGNRLKQNLDYVQMLDPWTGGRRCWTLKYQGQPAFHLDILPAIPDDPQELKSVGIAPELRQTAIQITDKTTWTTPPTNRPWPKSNPKGFISWFQDRMRRQLFEAKKAVFNKSRRMAFAEGLYAEVEQIPDYRVSTPLQGAVQILKYHRDLYFEDRTDKPISIIITTLAALAYQNEDTLARAVLNIVPGMRRNVRKVNGKFRIPNPVDPRENFADKWAKDPYQAEIFFEWLDAVEALANRIAVSQSTGELRKSISSELDHRHAETALERTLEKSSSARWAGNTAVGATLVAPRTTEAMRPGVRHKPTPPWREI